MKRVFYLLILGIAVGAVAYWRYCTFVPKEEGVAYLKTVKIRPFSDITGPVSSYASVESGKPSELLDLPRTITETSADIQYYHLAIGQKKVFFLVQNLPDGNARGWIDANLNNRLSDEKSLSGTSKKYSYSKSSTTKYFDFGIIQLADENSFFSPFHLICYHRRTAMVCPTFYKWGKMRLGDNVYRVAVIDGDYDGKFQTLFKNATQNHRYGGCDAFGLDNDTNVFFGRRQIDTGKIVPLGRYFKIEDVSSGDTKGRYYSLSIEPDGKTVRMAPAEPAMGTLQIGSNTRVSAKLLSDMATQWVNFKGEVKLPVGRYQMRRGSLTCTDADGKEWELSATFENDIRKGLFEIVEGQAVMLNPGPPFKLKTDLYKKDGNQLSINVVLVGSEGEEYGLRLDQSANEPTLKIFDENGEMLHTGSMEYG